MVADMVGAFIKTILLAPFLVVGAAFAVLTYALVLPFVAAVEMFSWARDRWKRRTLR